MSKLYIVPTPIGNLDDMTYRSVRVLQEAELILAEDTRQTGKLLQHFGISNNMKAYHQYNEHKLTADLVEKLRATCATWALVSDAGMPGISDPAYLMIKHALEAGIWVEALPGPTALIPALVNSGLPCDRFVFEGFLPHKKGRQKRLKALQAEERTLVFYESPYRLLKTLDQFCETFGEDRPASVSRELTKVYEETLRGTLGELKAQFELYSKIKGEIVIIVQGA